MHVQTSSGEWRDRRAARRFGGGGRRTSSQVCSPGTACCAPTSAKAKAEATARGQECLRHAARLWHNTAAMTATTATPLPSRNRQFVLAARPVGMPKESDFRLVGAPIPALASGQILIRTLFLSVDPYMRGRMTGIRTYADPVDIGQLMVGGTVGKVLQSQNPKFQAGDIVVGYWGWQEY